MCLSKLSLLYIVIPNMSNSLSSGKENWWSVWPLIKAWCFFLPFWIYHWSAFSTSLQMYQCRTSGSTLEWYIWGQQMSRGTPQLVVAHHSAKFSCCGQYFMFGPPGHAFVSLLVVCLLRVCKKFSVLKYSVGVTCHVLFLVEQTVNKCNAVCEINRWDRLFHIFRQHQHFSSPTSRATRKALPQFFHQPRRDFPAISGRPWILLLVNCLMSAFGKRFRNSARSFALEATDVFFGLWRWQPLCPCVYV